VNLSFLFLCRSSMMKSGLTFPLVVWPKLCITSSCNNKKCDTYLYITMFNDYIHAFKQSTLHK
jgi:hypothetical protein